MPECFQTSENFSPNRNETTGNLNAIILEDKNNNSSRKRISRKTNCLYDYLEIID